MGKNLKKALVLQSIVPVQAFLVAIMVLMLLESRLVDLIQISI
jgi:hypothetical protein